LIRVAGLVHDRMTEMPYPTPLETFETGILPEPTRTVPILEEGRPALEAVSDSIPGALRSTLRYILKEYWTLSTRGFSLQPILREYQCLMDGPGMPVLVPPREYHHPMSSMTI
jgi:hypothetical protein